MFFGSRFFMSTLFFINWRLVSQKAFLVQELNARIVLWIATVQSTWHIIDHCRRRWWNQRRGTSSFMHSKHKQLLLSSSQTFLLYSLKTPFPEPNLRDVCIHLWQDHIQTSRSVIGGQSTSWQVEKSKSDFTDQCIVNCTITVDFTKSPDMKIWIIKEQWGKYFTLLACSNGLLW